MIRVIIEAPPAEGKTTIALAIVNHLKQLGFTNVKVDDVDVEYATEYPQLQPMRLKAIRDRQVVVETRPEPRKPVKVNGEQG